MWHPTAGSTNGGGWQRPGTALPLLEAGGPHSRIGTHSYLGIMAAGHDRESNPRAFGSGTTPLPPGDGTAIVFRTPAAANQTARRPVSPGRTARDLAATKTQPRNLTIAQPKSYLGDIHMKNAFVQFLNDESGQDLIEYTLLMAFVALASAAIFITAGTSISTIWTNAQGRLTTAAS